MVANNTRRLLGISDVKVHNGEIIYWYNAKLSFLFSLLTAQIQHLIESIEQMFSGTVFGLSSPFLRLLKKQKIILYVNKYAV